MAKQPSPSGLVQSRPGAVNLNEEAEGLKGRIIRCEGFCLGEKGARPGHCPNAPGVVLGDAALSSSRPVRRGRAGQLESLCQALPGLLRRPQEAGPAAAKEWRVPCPHLEERAGCVGTGAPESGVPAVLE